MMNKGRRGVPWWPSPLVLLFVIRTSSFVLRHTSPRREPFGEEDADDFGDWDGEERAEDAEEFATRKHRQEDRQRVELHAATVDERLQDVVLDLLIDQEEDDQNDALDRIDEEADGADDDRA